MRAIGASEKIASVAVGRMSCASAARNSFELAGKQAVDQVEAGDGRRRRIEDVEPPERRRRPAELEVEHVDQQQAGEEHRQRHTRGCDDPAGVVDERALLHGGEDAERHRDQHRDDEAHQGQLRRGGQARGDIVEHRLAGGERLAEIAMGEVDDIAHELLGQRLVEAELLADLFDRLRARGRPGEIGRGVAGQHAGEQEGDDDDADEARDHRQQPFSDLHHGRGLRSRTVNP